MKPHRYLMGDIVARTSQVFAVSRDDILGQSRRRDLILARHVVCKLAREMTELSYPEIGRRLGGRDHTTIMHGRRTCNMRMGRDKTYAARVRLVAHLVKRGAPFSRAKPKPIDAAPLPKIAWRKEPDKAAEEWWLADDDDLLSDAVRAHYAAGGDFLEVWS